jgi:endo-1,4-beta-D-glucanase Y
MGAPPIIGVRHDPFVFAEPALDYGFFEAELPLKACHNLRIAKFDKTILKRYIYLYNIREGCMNKFFISAVVVFSMTGLVSGQARPFPQNITYAYGYKSTKVTSADAQSAYNSWKTVFLKNDCSNTAWYRVNAEGNGESKSEGMGYGMILTAYYGEKTYFDGLLAFYKAKRIAGTKMLMQWDVTCTGIYSSGGDGSATDGDLDAAYAYKQWGGNYLKECDTSLGYLEASYIVNCGSGVKTLVPGIGGGSAWGGCSLTDLSYYTPAHFRLFAMADNNTIWNNVANDAYSILAASANATTGLVPDWEAYNGSCGSCGGRKTYYSYDASRVPWRMAMDYLWNGNTTAHDWCTKVTNWANSKGAHNIVDGYNLDGSNNGQYHNSTFVGGFAVGCMCNSQAIVDTFSSELKGINDGQSLSQYFNLTLRCIYMLILSGNYWKPDPSTGVTEDIKVTARTGRRPLLVATGTTLTVKGLSGIRSVALFTPAGNLVQCLTMTHREKARVDVLSLSRGAYIVRLTSDGGTYALKFVKQ